MVISLGLVVAANFGNQGRFGFRYFCRGAPTILTSATRFYSTFFKQVTACGAQEGHLPLEASATIAYQQMQTQGYPLPERQATVQGL
jgi:hypothetical protein